MKNDNYFDRIRRELNIDSATEIRRKSIEYVKENICDSEQSRFFKTVDWYQIQRANYFKRFACMYKGERLQYTFHSYYFGQYYYAMINNEKITNDDLDTRVCRILKYAKRIFKKEDQLLEEFKYKQQYEKIFT